MAQKKRTEIVWNVAKKRLVIKYEDNTKMTFVGELAKMQAERLAKDEKLNIPIKKQ